MTELRDLIARFRRDHGGSMGETADGVRELSAMFNGVTPFRPGYLSARRLLRAYVSYYLPVNHEKVRRVLAELETYAPPGDPPRVLDYGCGPGTASIALLQRRPVRELCLVDVVDAALDAAKFFTRELGAEPRCSHEIPPGPFDLILAANVFAEHRPRLEERLSDTGHLIVVEPALRQNTRRLMEWRDRLAAEGYRIAAPCLGRSGCPMLEHSDLWCHQDIPWPRPGPVAEVDRRVGLIKETLKFSYVVVTRNGPTRADLRGGWRVVSNLHKEKGKAWAWLCGREGPLCRTEVLTRHRGEETIEFFRANRGDILELEASGSFTRSQGPVRRVKRMSDVGSRMLDGPAPGAPGTAREPDPESGI